MDIDYHEAAAQELIHGIGYLELRARGLGRRFLTEVRKAENLMTQFPLAAVEIMPGIHKHLLPKFGYSLIYTVETGRLLILAVAHHSRRPDYWVGRISPTWGEPEGST